jgi:hypothetical protein
VPTYAQLESERWWGREIVTAELDWLGDQLCSRLRRPRAAAGSKGDNQHLNGAHRSQEWILNSRYCTSRTYTVQGGLNATQLRHISGFDLVPGEWGSAQNQRLMIEQTGRLLAAMRGGKLNEVRELFGTTNGSTVTGWNNVTNTFTSSDSSHLEHWHLSLDRRHCANRALMERIVAITLGEDDDDMPTVDEIWAKRFAEYVDEDGNGRRDMRTVADILFATHRAALAAANPDRIVAGVLAGLRELPSGVTVSDEQLERVVRRAIDDVDRGDVPAPRTPGPVG